MVFGSRAIAASRPRPLRHVRALAWVALLVACALVGAAPAAVAKPSIILIITDDMEAGLVERMPSVTSLIVRQGATFARAFYNDPLCCPSRVTMLTGRYAQNTGVTANRHSQFLNSGLTTRTTPVWLKAAGYRTALIGKYLTGYPDPAPVSYVPPGWDVWAARTGAGGGEQYDYTLSENGRAVAYGGAPADYATDVYRRKAVDFIARAAADGVPFYLELGLHAPHRPSTPAPRHAALFPGLQAPRTASFNEADVTDKPAYVRNRSPLSRGGIAAIDREYRLRVQSLQAVDEAVRGIVDALAAAGRLADTYIVFTSDNGWLLGQHRFRGAKGPPYEESIRMPLHVRGPGVRAGVVLPHLVGNVDLAPTFADWAGATASADIDGRSLAPLLRAGAPPPEAWRQAYPLVFVARAGLPSWRGVRTRDFTYAEYATGERELYDLRTDPLQLQNGVGTAPAALLAKLAARTAALSRCRGAECRRAEDAPL